MFKKLLQKVENNESSPSSSSKRGEENRLASRSTGLKKTESLSSLNSFDDGVSTNNNHVDYL